SPPGPFAVLRIPHQRIHRSLQSPFSCARRVANCAGVSRPAMESGVHDGSSLFARRASSILARSTVLQAGKVRRRGRVAPGLFLLDADEADGAPFVLDWAGRFNAGEWLRPLCTAKSPLGPAADHGFGRGYECDPDRADRRAEKTIQPHTDRAKE